MLSALFASASLGLLLGGCVNTTQECTGGLSCCNASDHCEAVDQYYSKCVFQPTCAADGAQCAGTGQSVMERTPCCSPGFECRDVNIYYSHCVNASIPIPPPSPPAPPAPPPKTCADDGSQCAGGSFSPIGCCSNQSKCEVVNQYFSKCVNQPACVDQNQLCEGTGDHVMEKTPCCDTTQTCVPWGIGWNVCRAAGQETCAIRGEQCAGKGASAMDPKDCCDPTNTCIKVNEYYSKCDVPVKPGLMGRVRDTCPGLEECPH